MIAVAADTEALVARRLLREAANRGEVIISVARGALCLLVLVRFAYVETSLTDSGRFWRLVTESLLLLPVVVGSFISWRAARAGRFDERALSGLALLDAMVCTGSLSLNVLWPSAGYLGLLRMPDVAATLGVVWAGILRLEGRAVLTGAAIQTVLLAVLVAVDQTRNAALAAYGTAEVTMIFILLLASGVTAWKVADRVSALVSRAGLESARLERARNHLDALLRDHHDVRTHLSSVQLSLELAARTLDADHNHQLFDVARRGVSSAVESVKYIREHALIELAMLDGVAPAELVMSMRAAVSVVMLRFPDTSILIDEQDAFLVRIAGGCRALTHVLLNLLANACEGDGAKAARHIHISTHAQVSAGKRCCIIAVNDDGPGFPCELLNSLPTLGVTTKPSGTGLGLMLIAKVIQASAGSLQLSNPAEGGARVHLQLECA